MRYLYLMFACLSLGFALTGCYLSHERPIPVILTRDSGPIVSDAGPVLPMPDAGPSAPDAPVPVARFRFCEPWAFSGAPPHVAEAMGLRGCCVDEGEFLRADTAEPGMLIKGSHHTVYYVASNGRRYVFPSSHYLASWYVDASSPVPFGQDASACGLVVQVPDALLATMMIGGNVPMRPGLVTTGIYTTATRYVVDHGNVLRPISDATIDLNLAEPWLVGRDILTPDALFATFTMGAFVTAGYDGERLYREATLEGEVRAAHGW